MEPILKEFIDLLVGDFDNQEQYDQIFVNNNKFPFAKHKNTIINDKIINLPVEFEGIFMLEESYYTINNQTKALPHLFLFTVENKQVILNSYEIPKGYDNNSFNYNNIKLLNYNELIKSAKFSPAIYTYQNGCWIGGSSSQFSETVQFILWEKFSIDSLEVSEIMLANGKKVFGYDVPIIYKRKRIILDNKNLN